MKTRIRMLSVVLWTCVFPLSLPAQQQNPYILNGNAIQENCNCYGLTEDVNWQTASVWNKNKINLSASFNYIFNVFLGYKDYEGADGIAFVLQPIGTNIGVSGQGMGFQDVSPSIGIPIDTYQNVDFNDPPYDHIGIYRNGDLKNGSTNTLAGPVQAVANQDNIEDGSWHTLRIVWDAPAQLLSAYVDEVLRVQTHTDLVKDVFRGDPDVFWGFTAATGGSSNVQKFCTSLTAGLTYPTEIKTCAPALIPFSDHSTSFGSIINWWWDFGDGSTFIGQQPPPHAYAVPGNYTVKLNIEANNGCVSDTLYQKIVIGSIPTADFITSPPVICADAAADFIDASSVQYGTIDAWIWTFNSTETIRTSTAGLSKIFPVGSLQTALVVETKEGCVSQPVEKTMRITPKPAGSISVQSEACYGNPVSMTATNLNQAVPIAQWYWFPGDGHKDSSANLQYYYASGQTYTVKGYAVNEAGCSSDTLTEIVTVYQSNAKTGNDTIVAFGQPLQLNATGGAYYEWLPADHLNNAFIANPVAILNSNMQYVVKAFTAFGCPTYDTINIKAYRGPQLYVPNAFSPNNDGLNDLFHPVPVGMQTIDYLEIFDRLGQRVYRSEGNNAGWDGTIHGKPQPVGTYVWIMRGTDYQGKVHQEQGSLVLIR